MYNGYNNRKEKQVMKKISALLCSLAAVFALVGCSKGTKVSAEEFAAKAAQIQEKTYSSAVIEFDIDIESDYSGEKDSFKKEGKIEVTFEGTKAKAASDEDAKVLKYLDMYFDEKMVDVIGELAHQSDYYKASGVEVKTQYYVDPFGFTMEGSGSYEKAGKGSGSVSCDLYIRFNDYGWVDHLEMEFEAKGTSIYEGVSYSSSEKTNVEFSVEYK